MRYGLLFGIFLFVLVFGCLTPAQKFENKTSNESDNMTKNTKNKEILIKEKESTTIEGWFVSVDSVWISGGVIRADLVMWAENHMKPFSGGYKTGDEVEIGITDHKRYVKEVKKYGKNNEKKGHVVLLEKKSAGVPISITYAEEVSIEETTKARLDEVEFGVGNIFKKDGKMRAMIYSPENSSFGGDTEIFENDTLWVGTSAYNVEKITVSQGKENGFIKLKRLNQKLE